MYIGQTTQPLNVRWQNHINTANSTNVPHFAIHNAILKYGLEHFIIEPIENNVPYHLLNEKECYWIQSYNSKAPNGYNLTDGGDDCGRKEVWKINISSNQVVAKYGSATEAALINNLDLSGLTKVCRRECSSYGGYKWCYADEYDYEYLSNLKTHGTRKICQISQFTNELVNVWDSVMEATINTGTNQASLSACLSGKNKTANGYNWCYLDDYNSFIPVTQFRKVIQLDKNTDGFIAEWENAKEAASYLGKPDAGNIRRVCSGKQKTAYGYKWKYKEV